MDPKPETLNPESLGIMQETHGSRVWERLVVFSTSAFELWLSAVRSRNSTEHEPLEATTGNVFMALVHVPFRAYWL